MAALRLPSVCHDQQRGIDMLWYILGLVWFALAYFGWSLCYVAGEADKRDGLK